MQKKHTIYTTTIPSFYQSKISIKESYIHILDILLIDILQTI